MADPLTLLREYNINRKPVIEEKGLIQLGDFVWPKDIKTNYIIWGTGKDGGKKDYYTLESILFLLEHVTVPHSQYVRRAANVDIPVVCRPDRKDLLNYLNGEIATSQNVDKSAPLDITLQRKVAKRGALPSAPTAFDENKSSTDPASKKPRLDDVPKQARTRRLDELLEGRTNDSTTVISDKTDNSLVQALSNEKVAMLAAKFRSRRQRTTVREVDESNQAVPTYDDGDDRDTEEIKLEILSRERNWRTRSTVLQSGAKSFSKNVFAILSSIKAKEEGRHNQDVPPPSSSITSLNSSAKASMLAMQKKTQPAPQAGYSRYDQERFRGKEETLGFRIDTTGTYHDMSLKSVMEGAATKKMSSNKPHPSMKPTKAIVPQKPQKRISRTPIIIIPAATTSLITLYNVKDMLQDLKFVPTSTKKENGMRRDNEVLIQRRKDNGIQSIPYRVIDNITKLQTIDEWDRVVAVFVQGPAWQFKGWPWLQDNSPVEIFSKIQAFHVKFSEQKMDANVSKWNVHVMQLSETKRHMDRAVFYKFWEVLDRYMTKNKPHLRF